MLALVHVGSMTCLKRLGVDFHLESLQPGLGGDAGRSQPAPDRAQVLGRGHGGFVDHLLLLGLADSGQLLALGNMRELHGQVVWLSGGAHADAWQLWPQQPAHPRPTCHYGLERMAGLLDGMLAPNEVIL